MKWQLIDSGTGNGDLHMQKDVTLLENLEKEQRPVLHFYEWENKTISYGYFIDPDKYLNLEALKKHEVVLVKRPTGGGIVFHLTDFAFSVLLPSSHSKFSLNPLDNYNFINEVIKKALFDFMGKNPDLQLLPSKHLETTEDASTFCMAKPTQYDVLLNGLKIGGGAARLKKFGLLHQATIALSMPADELLEESLKSTSILHCMKKNSCLLLEGFVTNQVLEEAKKKLKMHLIENFLKEV